MKTFMSFLLFVILVFLPQAGFPGGEVTLSQEQSALKTSVPPVLPHGARVSEKIYGLDGLENVGRVSAGIYRGAQPLPEGYKTLREMGFRTVINLRSRHSEKQAVEANGMKSIEVPFNIFKKIDAEAVENVIAHMKASDNQPVYVHCKLGQDRTGMVVAVYRMEVQGWPPEEAEAEMQDFGFNDIWYNIKNFLRDYANHSNK